jgi:hypothetical protein
MDFRSACQGAVILIASVILVYLAVDYYKRHNKSSAVEKFETYAPLENAEMDPPSSDPAAVTEKITADPQELTVDQKKTAKQPRDCFPKDQLSPQDLLPKNAANSKWAMANPAGQGDVKNMNFLSAGYHMGVNSIGSTLRNANMQIRSEPPNPQLKVSPWLQTTIEPDMNRRPLEINGC